eukprot:gene4967-15556_t
MYRGSAAANRCMIKVLLFGGGALGGKLGALQVGELFAGVLFAKLGAGALQVLQVGARGGAHDGASMGL